MKTKNNKLKGQNLLRHEKIESLLVNEGQLISGSVGLLHILKLLFSSRKENFYFHFLEMYDFCLVSLFSEYRYRFESGSLSLTSPLGFAYNLAKVLFFRVLIRDSDIIILSSEMRIKYAKKRGFKNEFFCIKNKPLYSHDIEIKEPRQEKIVLIGNLNQRDDFLKVVQFAIDSGLEISCYGISAKDQQWLKTYHFDNVKCIDKVSSDDIPRLLYTSKYSICLYSNSSINQRFSASSKLFESLYFGCIPIVSNNRGVLREMEEYRIDFLNVSNLSDASNMNVSDRVVLDLKYVFDFELNKLKARLHK